MYLNKNLMHVQLFFVSSTNLLNSYDVKKIKQPDALQCYRDAIKINAFCLQHNLYQYHITFGLLYVVVQKIKEKCLGYSKPFLSGLNDKIKFCLIED